IIPYSIPLWTILTKCPEPDGPQWMYPSSAVEAAVPAIFSRPGVRGMSPRPGASVLKIGSRRWTASFGPPIIMQYPRSSPQTPPLRRRSSLRHRGSDRTPPSCDRRASGAASCWRPCAPDLPFPVAFMLLQFRVGRARDPSPHDPRWLREDILQKLLQNLLYQFREFAESRFHVAAKMHAQRAAVAVG